MRYWGLTVLLVVLLSACSSTKNTVRNQPVNEAIVRFQQGEAAFEDENYLSAIEHWQAVRDMYYTKELTTLAEQKIADAQYAAGMTIEAIAGYENFLKQHPGYPQTPEIMMRLGKAHFSQMLSEDRDQTATRNALATFEQLKKNYASEKYRAELDDAIRQCKERLAANELYVAEFYLKTKRYDAATTRIEYLQQHYPDFTQMAKAEFALAKAGFFTGAKDQSITILNQLENNISDPDLLEDIQDFREDQQI